MYITKRDRLIMLWIEDHRSITCNQCAKIFYKGHKHSYMEAQRRLKILYDNKYIKRSRKSPQHEYIYFLEKKLSEHDIKVMDAISELYKLDIEDLKVYKEYKIEYLNKNYRIDALIEFKLNDYFYAAIIEIDLSHFTSLKKLNDIYNSKHFQQRYKDLEELYPAVFVFRAYPPEKLEDTEYQLYYDDFTMTKFISRLISS